MLLIAILGCTGFFSSTGCGSGYSTAIPASSAADSLAVLIVAPVTQTVVIGSSTHFVAATASGRALPADCTWTSANSSVLKSMGNGDFVGVTAGSTSVAIQCGADTASASAAVSTKDNPTAIRITSGGIYSGNWSSQDPAVPAILIQTNDPVTLVNSTVTGKSTLIMVYGSGKGADLTLNNVTGTGIDPGVKGLARGKFLGAEVMTRLTVTHCTMSGVSFGVYVTSSTLQTLVITQNAVHNLDDRIDDGMGGHLTDQRVLGHAILVSLSTALNGAEIAWNEVLNDPGVASVEDVINIYESHGLSAAKPILIHDNYIQGAFATGLTTWYTGVGIQMDGDTADPAHATGFVNVFNNTVVHVAGSGISIGTGHDITMQANRVVSCGLDATTGQPMDFYGSAFVLLNYYQLTGFSNNHILGNTGGLVITGPDGHPVASDIDLRSASALLQNTASNNNMDDPCFVNGKINIAAEELEWTNWQKRIESQEIVLGDQH